MDKKNNNGESRYLGKRKRLKMRETKTKKQPKAMCYMNKMWSFL